MRVSIPGGRVQQAVRMLLVLACAAIAADAAAQTHVHHSGLPHGIPDFCATPNIRSVKSGAWSAADTWSPARVPAAGDVVAVEKGTTVTYDTAVAPSLECVGIHGALKFRTNINTRLRAGAVMVMPGGELEIGREGAPVEPSVVAEIVIADKPLNLDDDPEQFGTSFIGLGKVTFHGAPKSLTFVRLTKEPRVGDTSLSLETAPTGWAPGDQLIIPDTRQLTIAEWNVADITKFAPQWEERSLKSLSGTALALDSGLDFDHRGARRKMSDATPEFLPHVGNLTRNVIVRSENPAGTRGHVLLSHRADVDIRYTAFSDLGRTTEKPLDSTTLDATTGIATHIGTNQIGRYAVHFHHVMGPYPATSEYQYRFIGNAILSSRKWALAIHATHYGLIRDNVVYNYLGAGVMFEDGSESENLVERNFVLRGTGEGGRDAGGREGSGMYFAGVNNRVRNNVAANVINFDHPNSAYGFKYFLMFRGIVRIPKFPGADPSLSTEGTALNASSMGILQFENNEAYGAIENGLTYWWIGAQAQKPLDDAKPSVIKNLRVWHQHNFGIFHYNTSRLIVDGLVMRAVAGRKGTLGIFGADYVGKDWQLLNADIRNQTRGFQVQWHTGGTDVQIKNSYFENDVNVELRTLRATTIRADYIPQRRVFITDSRFVSPEHMPATHIDMLYQPEYGDSNLIQNDEVHVYNFNGVAGDNFRVYYKEQAPNFVMPKTVTYGAGRFLLLGSPEAGLTNLQNYAKYGIAMGGAVAPCATTRTGVNGFVCPMSSTVSRPPAPPTGVKVIR